MKILLDTHPFLYAIQEPERLSPIVRDLLEDVKIPRWVSVVSLWEIAVKIQIGKLDLPRNAGFYQKHIRALRALVLPVDVRHSMGLMELPLHHKDPFDRLLISQAREENMTLMTRDGAFGEYDVKTIW